MMIDLLSIIIGKDFSHSVEATFNLNTLLSVRYYWVIQLWYYAFLLTIDKIPYWKDLYVHAEIPLSRNYEGNGYKAFGVTISGIVWVDKR